MKFSFEILKYNHKSELMTVQYTPADSDLNVLESNFNVAQKDDGTWPDADDIIRMIKGNAPMAVWERQARSQAQTNISIQPIKDLIGYSEIDVEDPRIPDGFDSEGTI